MIIPILREVGPVEKPPVPANIDIMNQIPQLIVVIFIIAFLTLYCVKLNKGKK